MPSPPSWVKDVKPGDRLRLDPSWNETSGPGLKLPEVVEMAYVREGAGCQSGVMFELRESDRSGRVVSLDAGWFLGVE